MRKLVVRALARLFTTAWFLLDFLQYGKRR